MAPDCVGHASLTTSISAIPSGARSTPHAATLTPRSRSRCGPVLQAERIAALQKIAPPHVLNTDLDCTLLCFVLIDPAGAHAFCSRYDFGPWPLLQVCWVDARGMGLCCNGGGVWMLIPLQLIHSAVLGYSLASCNQCPSCSRRMSLNCRLVQPRGKSGTDQ